MTAVIEVDGLTRRYGRLAAVDDATFTLEGNRIHGLLGRNGAGKTTLMQLLTGQEFASSGTIRVFGQSPVENAGVLQHVSFIKESQRYPEDFRPKHVLRSAPWFFENWDAEFAEQLVDDFRLPLNTRIKKLSRGQLSAIGVIVGLASRAPLTFFDEPYLGLDAVSRHMFYDRLLADYAENPRTVVLSTHLIDEVSNLIEHVILIDKGRILLDAESDDLRERAFEITGPTEAVDRFAAEHRVLHRTALGSTARATIDGRLNDHQQSLGVASGLSIEPIPLQQLIIDRTTAHSGSIHESTTAEEALS